MPTFFFFFLSRIALFNLQSLTQMTLGFQEATSNTPTHQSALFIPKKGERGICGTDVMDGESGSRFEIQIFLSLHEEAPVMLNLNQEHKTVAATHFIQAKASLGS